MTQEINSTKKLIRIVKSPGIYLMLLMSRHKFSFTVKHWYRLWHGRWYRLGYRYEISYLTAATILQVIAKPVSRLYKFKAIYAI